jgi:hypothetical protein
LAFGGFAPPNTAATESWNGTSWTNENLMSTSRDDLAGAGTQTSGLAIGGKQGSPELTATEEWIGNGIITETVD